VLRRRIGIAALASCAVVAGCASGGRPVSQPSTAASMSSPTSLSPSASPRESQGSVVDFAGVSFRIPVGWALSQVQGRACAEPAHPSAHAPTWQGCAGIWVEPYSSDPASTGTDAEGPGYVWFHSSGVLGCPFPGASGQGDVVLVPGTLTSDGITTAGANVYHWYQWSAQCTVAGSQPPMVSQRFSPRVWWLPNPGVAFVDVTGHPQTAAILASVAAARSASPPPIPTTTTAALLTRVVVYEPFTAGGAIAPGIQVVGQASDADCYEGAISSPRKDAFRCFAETGTQQSFAGDPCFLDPIGPPRLACLALPTDPSRVVIVTPAAPFPSHPNTGVANPATGYPWLIQLANGQVCGDATGGTAYFPTIGRANWGCPNGWGWGVVQRTLPYWTLGVSTGQSLVSRTPPPLTQVQIAIAWF
jgi:hypothetical protein